MKAILKIWVGMFLCVSLFFSGKLNAAMPCCQQGFSQQQQASLETQAKPHEHVKHCHQSRSHDSADSTNTNEQMPSSHHQCTGCVCMNILPVSLLAPGQSYQSLLSFAVNEVFLTPHSYYSSLQSPPPKYN